MKKSPTILSIITIMLLLVAPSFVMAATYSGPPEIKQGDVERIIWHAINIAILFGLLFYLLKNQITEFFTTRGDQFDKAKLAAERAKAEAQRHNTEIKEKLNKLLSDAAASVERAKRDAHSNQIKTIEDAKIAAKRMIEDSNKMGDVETQTAVETLKDEFVDMGIAGAKLYLKNSVTEDQQKKLSKEFIEKIQAV